MSTALTPEQVSDNGDVVTQLRVVVHTMGPVGSAISDNHWSIYLLIGNGGSVRMNMEQINMEI